MKTNNPSLPCHAIGESCLCWTLGAEPEPAVSHRVLAAFQAVQSLRAAGRLTILDAVPTYQTLAVYFDPLATPAADIKAAVEAAILPAAPATATTPSPTTPARRPLELPTRYDGPDLDRVAAQAGLSRAEAISLHSEARYTVAMIGFLPHFPYLLGLPARLACPRLDTPRRQVPAGAVTLADTQLGIYPKDSSGAWNIIAAVEPGRLDELEPGDAVRFIPVEPSS